LQGSIIHINIWESMFLVVPRVYLWVGFVKILYSWFIVLITHMTRCMWKKMKDGRLANQKFEGLLNSLSKATKVFKVFSICVQLNRILKQFLWYPGKSEYVTISMIMYDSQGTYWWCMGFIFLEVQYLHLAYSTLNKIYCWDS